MSFRHLEFRAEMLLTLLPPGAGELALTILSVMLLTGGVCFHLLPTFAFAVPSTPSRAEEEKLSGNKPSDIECNFAYSTMMDCYLWGPYPERCPIKKVASKAKDKFFPKYDTTLTAQAQAQFIRRFEASCHLGCLLRSRKQAAPTKIPLCQSQGIIPLGSK